MKSGMLASGGIVVSLLGALAACSGAGGTGGTGGGAVTSAQSTGSSGSNSTGTTTATGTSTTTATSTATGTTTTTGTSTGTSGSSSSTGMSHPFACGPMKMCDANGQYCKITEGFVVSYDCVNNPPCNGSDVVSCTCLNVQQLNCNSCMDMGGGANLNCGGG